MPEVDLTEVGAADEFSPAKVGKHLCVIESIDDSKSTKAGDEMWLLLMKIVDGEDKGREIRDNLSFGNSIALKRVKLVCSRVGIDTSKKFKLMPSMLTGKYVYVEIEKHREYQDTKGKMRKAADVAFAGYEMVDAEALARLSKGAKVRPEPETNADEADPF